MSVHTDIHLQSEDGINGNSQFARPHQNWSSMLASVHQYIAQAKLQPSRIAASRPATPVPDPISVLSSFHRTHSSVCTIRAPRHYKPGEVHLAKAETCLGSRNSHAQVAVRKTGPPSYR